MVRKGVALCVQQAVHVAQCGDVAFVELQECAACGEFLAIQADLVGDGVDHLCRFAHGRRITLLCPLRCLLDLGSHENHLWPLHQAEN